MSYKNFFLATVCACISFISPVTGAKPLRRITLSLGYDEKFNSNEGMKHLPLTTLQGYSWVFDQATKMTSGPISRTALVLSDLLMHFPFFGKNFSKGKYSWILRPTGWPGPIAFHEFGHARAKRAFSPTKFNGYTVNFEKTKISLDTVFGYYAYFMAKGRFCHGGSTLGPFTTTTPDLYLPIMAGGLNNETRLGAEIAEWTQKYNGHVGYFGSYVKQKLCSFAYSMRTTDLMFKNNIGDIAVLCKCYKKMDENFTQSHITWPSVLSLLLSGTTYSYLNGCWNFIKNGDPTVRTLTWKGFRLPDVNFYFTREGLAYEVITGYKLNPNLWLNLSLETVYYPKKGLEFTPSFRYTLPTKIYGLFDFEGGIVFNVKGEFGGYIGVEWTDPVNPFSLQTKVILHNMNTYVGERNIPNGLDGETDLEVMISASYNW